MFINIDTLIAYGEQIKYKINNFDSGTGILTIENDKVLDKEGKYLKILQSVGR